MSQSRISIPNKSSGPRKQMEHMIVTAKEHQGTSDGRPTSIPLTGHSDDPERWTYLLLSMQGPPGRLCDK